MQHQIKNLGEAAGRADLVVPKFTTGQEKTPYKQCVGNLRSIDAFHIAYPSHLKPLANYC